MAELVLKMSMTVDGFVAGPNGEMDWQMRSRDPAGAAWVAASIAGAGYHAMGSRTFRQWIGFWPTGPAPFAAHMNEIPKLVFSRGGAESEAATARAVDEARRGPVATSHPQALESWTQARTVSGDLATEMAKLKREPGKPIYAQGGASFCRALVELDLVDEYRLVVHPVAIGTGQALFSGLRQARDLQLVESTRFASGSFANVYRRAV
jgi:dihydrofolate reductase